MNRTRAVPLVIDSAGTSPAAVLYLAYARLLDFPAPELLDAIRAGEVARELRALHDAAGVPLPDLPDDCMDDLEQQYIGTFDVGAPESIAPLYETAYERPEGEDRRSVLEELVRFYEFFDLDLGKRPIEQPDHLTVELEFMAVLAQMESSCAEADSSRPFILAQRDFLSRHLLPFVDAVTGRPVPAGVYAAALDGLRMFLEAENGRLQECCRANTGATMAPEAGADSRQRTIGAG